MPTDQNAETRTEWVDREARRRLAEETRDAPRKLLPLDEFPTTSVFADVLNTRTQKREPGEPCRALEGLIAGSCSGWIRTPTAIEMETAIKSRWPNRRTRCLARVVLTEADTGCIAHAEAAGAFSLQDLAWWIEESGMRCYRRIKWLNAMGRAWQVRRRPPAGGATDG